MRTIIHHTVLLLLGAVVAFRAVDARSGQPPPPPPSANWGAPPPPEKGYINPLDPTQKVQAAASEAVTSNVASSSDTTPPQSPSSWNPDGDTYAGRTPPEADQRRYPDEDSYYDTSRDDHRPSQDNDYNDNTSTTTETTRTPAKLIEPIEIDPRDSKHVPIHYNFGGKDDEAAKPKTNGKRGFFFGRRRNNDDNEDSKEKEDSRDDAPSIPRDRRLDRDAPRRRGGDDFEQRRRREEDLYRRRGRYDDEDRRGGKYDYEDRGRRENDDYYRDTNNNNKDQVPSYASARRDVITRYQSTATGKLMLTLSCGMVGSIMGAFLGKSILNRPVGMAMTWSVIFIIVTLLRNPYGELVRALGMSIILALQRTTSIRRRYPTWRHIKASLGATERRPFPPTSNPWSYEPRRDFDPEFRMLFTVIAMAFVGSTCGGSVPLIPTWIGSLVGAGFFGLSTTMQSARGDLTRSMGMRVVALVEEFLGINTELEILSKGGVVSGKIFNKIMFLDSKHRIKDRIVAGASFAAGQISNQMNRVQSDMKQEGGGDEKIREGGGRQPGGRDEPDRGRSREEDNDRRGRPRDDGNDMRGSRDDPSRRSEDFGDRRGPPPRRDERR